MKILGIDEAGRGPVVGPLIIAGVMIKDKDSQKLTEIGAKDSKLLTQKQREAIAVEIKKIAKIKVIKIEPSEIDEAIDGNNTLNLNWLEAHKTAEIINILKPDEAFIDCPSPNIEMYTNYLKKLLKKSVKLVVEHKAEKFPVVGAASIIAKCIREEEVKAIEKLVGESIGSGYASNEICQEFLKKNWDKYPQIFRKSWVTWKNHKIAKQQKGLSEY